jgi:hypothetical protein
MRRSLVKFMMHDLQIYIKFMIVDNRSSRRLHRRRCSVLFRTVLVVPLLWRVSTRTSMGAALFLDEPMELTVKRIRFSGSTRRRELVRRKKNIQHPVSSRLTNNDDAEL